MSNPVDDDDEELDCDDREMEVYDVDILTEFVLPHLAKHLEIQVSGVRYLNDLVWELNVSEDVVRWMLLFFTVEIFTPTYYWLSYACVNLHRNTNIILIFFQCNKYLWNIRGDWKL